MPDIESVLASFDLLVLPSVLDGRPVVVLEATRAWCVPVLASHGGALPELIQDDVTGWLCEPEDLQASVTRIECAAKHVREQKCGAKARGGAEAHLDLKEMLQAYERGLTSLLAGGGNDA